MTLLIVIVNYWTASLTLDCLRSLQDEVGTVAGTRGVVTDPPRLVHFNGTIVTYRAVRDRGGRTIVDELFRVLLLASLEEQLPAENGPPIVPTVAELARGLIDPRAPVTYRTEGAVAEYPTFRRLLDELRGAPIFAGARAERIRELVRPFDEHFEPRVAEALGRAAVGSSGQSGFRLRTHGPG